MQAISRKEFVYRLNEDFSLELRAVVQNINHIAKLANESWLSSDARENLLHERVDWILQLASQLGGLGSSPAVDFPPPHLGHNIYAGMIEDLALERILLERYRRRLQQANDLGLDETSDFLAARFEGTAANVSFLEATVSGLADNASPR